MLVYLYSLLTYDIFLTPEKVEYLCNFYSVKETFGDQYKLFLLINPEDDKPVAVVVPKKTLQPETTGINTIIIII